MVLSIRLHNSKPRPGSSHRKKRLGCGESSGHGKTSGKGHKGQKARSGGSIRLGFEGGQMPLIRRLPKRGFNNAAFKTCYAPVNLRDLNRYKFNAVIDEKVLRDLGLVNGRWDGVKILGDGDLQVPISLKVNAISGSARMKVESVGGIIELLPAKIFPARNSAKNWRRLRLPSQTDLRVGLNQKTEKQVSFSREVIKAAKKAAEKQMGYRLHALGKELQKRMNQSRGLSKGEDILPRVILENNVHGIGFGRKYIKSQATSVQAVRFYVFQKAVGPSQVPHEFLLPKEVNGIPTDVIEMAPPHLLDLPSGSSIQNSPVARVSNPAGRPGTLGAYCRSVQPGNEKKLFLLSCMHVFFAEAQNKEIHHSLPNTPSRHIANRTQHAPWGPVDPVTGEKVLLADAAIAELIENERSIESSVCHLATVGTAAAQDGWEVTKRGVGSGTTKGTVVDVAFDSVVDLPNEPVRLEDQIIVWSADKISDNGDSGALLVHGAGNVVGICYAGSTLSPRPGSPIILEDYTFGNVLLASPIQPVLNELGVTLNGE